MPEKAPGSSSGSGSVPSARAYERLVGQLGAEVGARAAVSWAHAVALARHATAHGLVSSAPPTDAEQTLKVLDLLAAAHPALEDFADPQVVAARSAGLPVGSWQRASSFWDQVPLLDDQHRVDGYRIGDAYQALSAEARSARALCQTPPWVAGLLLDLSLEPATDEVGPARVRMIDPSCGTGHILLAAFHRVRTYRTRGRQGGGWPSTPSTLERALTAVHGVDLDPYAALLARYRLLGCTAAILGTTVDRVPSSWPISVHCADTLLDDREPLLLPGQYDAVVGNPPYITVRDPAVREEVRRRYPQVCHGKYSLALPFFARMTDLARPEGYIAQLTANSFMKREFGRKFIEEYLPALDLTWIVDTSGCYIPGHGTPTVILCHRNRAPVKDSVIAILGNRGEPGIPDDPARGLVWRAIEEEVHRRLSLQRLMSALHFDTL